MRFTVLIPIVAIGSVLCWTISAQAVYDISPRLNTTLSRLDTYGYDDAGDSGGGNPIYQTPQELRVFSYFYGDFGDPYFDQDPGIHALSTNSGYTPSGLPDGSYLSFNVLSDLQYWNGNGSVQFDRVPSAETLQLYLPPNPPHAPFNVTVGTDLGAFPQPGFVVGQASGGGFLHKHLWSELHAGSAAIPADGIYLFEMRMNLLQSDGSTPYPGVAPSLPFFVLFDNNKDLATYQAAQSWVQTNLVPFGDYNRDRTTTAADVQILISALGDLSKYQADNQLTDFELKAFGDINQDGQITSADVQSLQDYLAHGGTGDTGRDPPILAPGDFNGDGNVDGVDFAAWQTYFPTSSAATLPTGDADGDGDIDGADFVLWQTHFSTIPATATVPEPASIWLASMAATAGFIARRRKNAIERV